mmetsp:Transcript_8615/g.25210  ORF Transcript_8615/g.25210 Transcript_8615/m.25210 type:complete len:223 (+) Transcript_8615:2944-3612(+)
MSMPHDWQPSSQTARVSSRLVIISSSSDPSSAFFSSTSMFSFSSISILATNLLRPTLAAFSIALSIAEATIFLPFPDSSDNVFAVASATFFPSILTKRNHSLSSFGSSLDGLPVDVSRALIAAETAKIPLSNLASKEVMSLGKISPFAEEMSPRLHPGLTIGSHETLRKASRIKNTRSLFLSISHNSLAMALRFVRSGSVSFFEVKATKVSTSMPLSASTSD